MLGSALIKDAYSLVRPYWLRVMAAVAMYIAAAVLTGFIATFIAVLFFAKGDPGYNPAIRLLHAILFAGPSIWFLNLFARYIRNPEEGFSILVWPGLRPLVNLAIFQFATQLFAVLVAYILSLLIALHPFIILAVSVLVLITIFWLVVRTAFVPILVLDEDQALLGAVQRSWAATSGAFWIVIVSMLLLAVVTLAGLLALGLGFLFTYGLAVAGYVLLFDRLSTRS